MSQTLEHPAAGGAWMERRPGGPAAVVVDGRCAAADPGGPYRVVIDTLARAVQVDGDGRALSFLCRSDPGRIGWWATGPGPDGRLHTVACSAAEVANACQRLPEADGALSVIAGAAADDVARRCAVDDACGAAERQAGLRLRRAALAALSLKRVPQRPLRDAFLTAHHQGELTAAGLAAAIGWRWGHSGTGDSTRLLRRLGLTTDHDERGVSHRYRRASAGERAVLDALAELGATIAYDLAVAICRGMDLDPSTFSWL